MAGIGISRQRKLKMKHFSNIVLTSLYSLSSLYCLYSLSSTKEKQGDKEAKEANVYKGISYTLGFIFARPYPLETCYLYEIKHKIAVHIINTLWTHKRIEVQN
jgi:hypothetical protein